MGSLPVLTGYACASITGQTLADQQDALTRAGCARIFTDTGSPPGYAGLTAALACLHPGDTLAVTRLAVLSRSLRHLLGALALLVERDIGLTSLHEGIATADAGDLVLPIVCALAGEPSLQDLDRQSPSPYRGKGVLDQASAGPWRVVQQGAREGWTRRQTPRDGQRASTRVGRAACQANLDH